MTAALPQIDTTFLDEIDAIGDDEQAPREGFACETQEQAEWAARKLAQAAIKIRENDQRHEVYVREVNRRAAAYVQREDEARRANNAPLERDVEFFTAVLEGYHRDLFEKDPAQKTVHLPGVELKARKQQPKWTIDPEPFIAWASANERDDLLRKKVDPDLAAAKKALTIAGDGAVDADGQEVDGVTVVTPTEPSFSVSVSDT